MTSINEPLSRTFVLLDDATAPSGSTSSRLYTDFARLDLLVPDTPSAAASTIDVVLADGWRQGWHACLFAPYEFGGPLVGVPVHLGNALPFQDGALRIVWFRSMARMDGGEVTAWLAAHDASPAPAGVMNVRDGLPESDFTESIARIHDWIEAGDTYQVNFTQRLRFSAFGSPLALYRRLRAAQPVPFAALARFPDDSWVLSLSPELFVRHDGNGSLTTKPMKGTAPLTGDPERDAAAATALAADPKNRAENVMIVDLLRNDLGRVAQPGTVAVPARFHVEPFGQVLQMTSTVTATARAGTTAGTLLAALFPCGSITGAPKRRTMAIITELEPSPRGLYTGAIGSIDAPATGQTGMGTLALSVAIRTLVLAAPGDDGLRAGEMGVGGGIVHDSVAPDEFAECGWKARFLTTLDPRFGLFETLRAEDGACPRLDAHLARLSVSAAALGFAFDRAATEAMVKAKAIELGAGTWRLRVSLDKVGTLALASGALAALPPGPVSVLIADAPLPNHDPLRRHKTTARAVYDAGWQAAERAGAFDALFFNARDELLEGGRSSVFVRIGDRWLTPPLSADILPGVMRAAVLADGVGHFGAPATEAVLTRDMLMRADAVAVVNALRGVMAATLK